MKNRLLINALLLITLIGLVSFIWLKPQNTEKQVVRLSQLNENDVTLIKIHRANQQDIKLEKKENSWSMTSPYSIAVSSNKIKLLLTLLKEPVKSAYSIEGKDLKSFKLDADNISVQFNNENKIIFGMTHPVSYDRYILKDNKILLISETVYGVLTSDVANFFNTRLVPKGVQITHIELPKKYKIADDTAAKWQLTKAIQVFDWDPTKSPSQATVHLTLDNGKTINYEIIETQPELWLGNTELKARYQIANENRLELLPKE